MSQIPDDRDFLDYADLGHSRPIDPMPIDTPIIDMRDTSKKTILGVEIGSKVFWIICVAIIGIAAYLYVRYKK